MPRYVLEVPTLATNGSTNSPALKSFDAPNDREAYEYCELHAKSLYTLFHSSPSNPFSSGGTNWTRIAQCRRSGTDKVIWPAHKRRAA